MSGGAFNYTQWNIRDIANSLELTIERNGKKKDNASEWEGEHYPEYSEETITRFQEAVDLLKLSLAYVDVIDYLLAGDIGEDTFRERLEKAIHYA